MAHNEVEPLARVRPQARWTAAGAGAGGGPAAYVVRRRAGRSARHGRRRRRHRAGRAGRTHRRGCRQPARHDAGGGQLVVPHSHAGRGAVAATDVDVRQWCRPRRDCVAGRWRPGRATVRTGGQVSGGGGADTPTARVTGCSIRSGRTRPGDCRPRARTRRRTPVTSPGPAGRSAGCANSRTAGRHPCRCTPSTRSPTKSVRRCGGQ